MSVTGWREHIRFFPIVPKSAQGSFLFKNFWPDQVGQIEFKTVNYKQTYKNMKHLLSVSVKSSSIITASCKSIKKRKKHDQWI